jgi:hypothetical protein
VKKLSELIREGAKLRPQYFGSYFGLNDESFLCSCALGAAFEAAGGSIERYLPNPPDDATWDSPVDIFQEAIGYDPNSILVESMSGKPWLESLIANWNDRDRLSREEIADKLEAMGY